MKIIVNQSHNPLKVSSEFKEKLGRFTLADYGRTNQHLIFLIEYYGYKRVFDSGDPAIIEIPDNVTDWKIEEDKFGKEVLKYVDNKTGTIKEI